MIIRRMHDRPENLVINVFAILNEYIPAEFIQK